VATQLVGSILQLPLVALESAKLHNQPIEHEPQTLNEILQR